LVTDYTSLHASPFDCLPVVEEMENAGLEDDRSTSRVDKRRRYWTKAVALRGLFVRCCRFSSRDIWSAIFQSSRGYLLSHPVSPVFKICSVDADKPARRVLRSVKVTKHSTIPYVRYFSSCVIVTLSFDFKKFPDLEIRVTGHSSSLKVIPFYRLAVVSY